MRGIQRLLPFKLWKSIDSEDTTPRWYVDDGCHKERGKVKDDFVGAFRNNSFNAGVRCCYGEMRYCRNVGKCPGQYTHDDAVKKCSEEGMRLCTKEELLSEVCCGMGGMCDNHPVWTSTLESGKNPQDMFNLVSKIQKSCTPQLWQYFPIWIRSQIWTRCTGSIGMPKWIPSSRFLI